MKYLLIDLSYFVFYRYFALINYLKCSKKLEKNAKEFYINDEFTTRYEAMFEKTILGLLQTHFGKKWNKENLGENGEIVDIMVIFGKDCERSTIWRNEYFPEYKCNRDENRNCLFDGNIFDYVYETIIPSLLEKYSFMKICFSDRAEADDVIAIAVYVINRVVSKESKIIIITNDHDYLQLLDDVDGIFNLRGVDLRTKACKGCAKNNMISKVLQGDPSDNIKGLVSKKKAMMLLSQFSTPEEIEACFLESATEIQKQHYSLNKRLICFSNIPNDIYEDTVRTIYDHMLSRSSV
jgi:5'-3' exonuclease